MKNKKRIFILILCFVFISFFIYLFGENRNLENDKMMEEKNLIAIEQRNIDKDLKSKGYTFDKPNVVLNPYKISPLTALIMFETKNEEEVKITVLGKDELSTFTNTYNKTKEHYIPVYGLYPDKENKVILEVNGNKKEITIKTDKLPKNFILPEYVKSDKSKLNNDLYFFTPASLGYTCAYDVNGDVRWYLSERMFWNVNRLKNGNLILSTERRVNPPYYTTGFYELDLLGKIYNEYSIKGGYHHDFFEMPNGNLLVASNDFNNESGTVEDYIVELDRKTGKEVKAFDLKDILKMNTGKSENWSQYDWFHNNSVWYDNKTNSITLSGRHQDAVINIDYKSGKLNWIIGDSKNWDKKYKKYFFTPIGNNDFEWQWSQHAAMVTPEGYIFILDNGNNKSKDKDKYVKAENSYTRGVMYKINTKDMTIEQVYEYGKKRGSSFYSPYISDVDYIEKNHYIVHSGGIVYVNGKNSNQPAGFAKKPKLNSITVELLNDVEIFEIKLPTNNYRVEKMSLYNNNEYYIKENKRLGSLGVTSVDNKKIGLLKDIHKIDKEYNKHNITFTNETDRLNLRGQFKKTDDVKIILYNNLISKEYNVPVSKKPYTALCVDIFTDEENENGIMINKYINKKGLHGKYSVYLSINNKLYNTGKYVRFNEK